MLTFLGEELILIGQLLPLDQQIENLKKNSFFATCSYKHKIIVKLLAK